MKNLILLSILVCLSGCAHSGWTKTDTTLLGLSIGASVLDVYTTTQGDFDHFYNPLMDEGNEIVIISLTELAVIGVACVVSPKLRRALLLSNIAARSGFALHNVLQD